MVAQRMPPSCGDRGYCLSTANERVVVRFRVLLLRLPFLCVLLVALKGSAFARGDDDATPLTVARCEALLGNQSVMPTLNRETRQLLFAGSENITLLAPNPPRITPPRGIDPDCAAPLCRCLNTSFNESTLGSEPVTVHYWPSAALLGCEEVPHQSLNGNTTGICRTTQGASSASDCVGEYVSCVLHRSHAYAPLHDALLAAVAGSSEAQDETVDGCNAAVCFLAAAEAQMTSGAATGFDSCLASAQAAMASNGQCDERVRAATSNDSGGATTTSAPETPSPVAPSQTVPPVLNTTQLVARRRQTSREALTLADIAAIEQAVETFATEQLPYLLPAAHPAAAPETTSSPVASSPTNLRPLAADSSCDPLGTVTVAAAPLRVVEGDLLLTVGYHPPPLLVAEGGGGGGGATPPCAAATSATQLAELITRRLEDALADTAAKAVELDALGLDGVLDGLPPPRASVPFITSSSTDEPSARHPMWSVALGSGIAVVLGIVVGGVLSRTVFQVQADEEPPAAMYRRAL